TCALPILGAAFGDRLVQCVLFAGFGLNVRHADLPESGERLRRETMPLRRRATALPCRDGEQGDDRRPALAFADQMPASATASTLGSGALPVIRRDSTSCTTGLLPTTPSMALPTERDLAKELKKSPSP